VFHQLYVPDQANKDKVMTGSTSHVKFVFQLPANRQWCKQSVLLIVLASHNFFPFWQRFTIFFNVPSACMETHVSLVKANTTYGHKTTMMIIRCSSNGRGHRNSHFDCKIPRLLQSPFLYTLFLCGRAH